MPLQPSSPWSLPQSPLPSHPALPSLAPQVRIVLEELDLSTLPPKEEGPPEAGAASPAAGKPPRPKKPRGESTPKGTPKRRPPLPPARVGDSTAGSHNAGTSLLDQLDMLASAAEAAGDFASPDQRVGGAAAAAAAAGQATDPGAAGQALINSGPLLGRLGSGGSTGGGGDSGGGIALDPQVAAAAARKLQQRAVEAFAAADRQSSDSMLRPFKLLLRAQPGSALFKVSLWEHCS